MEYVISDPFFACNLKGRERLEVCGVTWEVWLGLRLLRLSFYSPPRSLSFPLSEEPAGVVTSRRRPPVGMGSRCSCSDASAGSLRVGWRLWCQACVPEPGSSLLLFPLICGDAWPRRGLQKALAGHSLSYCWPFEVWWPGGWKEGFLKWWLWNSEFIFAILCVVFLFYY